MANPILKLGLPKGSLEDPTIDLFDRAGWKVRKHPRNYFPDINDPEITARLCRVQEIPLYIQDGVLDLGLTGKDWVKETKADVVVVSDLIYSKVSNKPARWVLAVADDSPYRKPEDLAGKRIATELMGVCTEYFKERNIPVNINYSWGATEAKVVEGLADAIVEVTETETTIRAHDLRVIDEVLVTNTVLIANAAAMQDPEKRRKIEQIDLLLQGALRAESLVCLKMNAPAAKLEAVLALLPSLNSPTVAPLQNGEWLSLETVVSTGIVRDLIPQLREAGAEGILEYALNKVIICKRHQMSSRKLNFIKTFFYLFFIVFIFTDYLEHTYNSVDRSTDIMTHTVNKLCFCTTCRICFFKCKLQALFFLLLFFMKHRCILK